MNLWRYAVATTVLLASACLATPGIADERSGFIAEKNHPKVLAAFRPVVQEASKSTVRVLADGKRVALGTVVDAEGFVLTKASELKGRLEVQSVDGTRTEATMVGVDRKLDLAMLKVERSDLQPIAWAEGELKTQRGSWVVTPGLERDPVGIGVVSAETREIKRAHGALGIELQDAPNGGGIRRVFPKSAAEKAGLRPGDVVTHVAGKGVDSLAALREEIFSYEPGDEVEVTVRRGSETFNAKIVLGNFQQMIQGERAEFQNSLGGQLSQRRAGFSKVLQHDTVLRPQDCGGPLLDIDGRAVGVNIARAGRVETYALAASEILPVLEDMKSGKYAPTSEAKPTETAARQ